MMRVLRLWCADAALSARRAWRTTLLALVVIGMATFVVGLSFAFSLGVRDAVGRLAATSGLSVFLDDEASDADATRVADLLRASPAVASTTYVTREEARERFAAAFPDLAQGVRDDVDALPRSFDVVLRDGSDAAVDALAAAIRADAAVADVRYDREWITRLEQVGRAVGRAGLALGVLLTFAAWTMLYAVVRLAYVARRDEIDILYLVGAPLPSIRGPFLVEGFGEGVVGAALGLVVLSVSLPAITTRLTASMTGLGFDVVPALPWVATMVMALVAGAAGALAAGMALRDAERHG